MKTIPKVALIFTVLTAGLFLTGCPQQRNIGEIEVNPSRYEGKEVIIVGRVRDSYGIGIPGTGISGGAYKIDDGTGSIWVITDRNVPSKGAEIGIKGVVTGGANWGGKNYGLGIMEEQRKYRRR